MVGLCLKITSTMVLVKFISHDVKISHSILFRIIACIIIKKKFKMYSIILKKTLLIVDICSEISKLIQCYSMAFLFCFM